jgi:hypothetical protein
MFSRTVEARELLAVRHYPYLEALIVEIEAAITEGRVSGPGPPPVISAPWLVVIASAIGRQCQARPVSKYTVAQLWFLSLGYLEIRDAPMYWYELDDDDCAYLTWFFGNSQGHAEDDVLGVRERLLIALRERDMRAPWVFFPLLDAAV